MVTAYNKRDCDIFLSHAHKDRAFVSEVDRWLTDKAGFKVWYDARELGGGALLATDLQQAIERCRGILLMASAEALARGWVKAEYNSAMDERANDPAFRVVALRLANAQVNELMKGTTWIDVPEQRLEVATALAIVRAFYPGEKLPNPATARDIFISSSWRGEDGASAHAVCRELHEEGFRLIGDARDQQGFGKGNRVQRIIESCGAYVGIIPFRDSESRASAVDGPYKYFLQEADYAAQIGLPSVIVADPRVKREDGPDTGWLRLETGATDCTPAVKSECRRLDDRWQPAKRPQFVFCAMDLESDAARPQGPIRHLIERITGMPTFVGSEINDVPLEAAIMNKVCQAFLVLADISGNSVNPCVEAGMGLAAGTNVELISQGTRRSPPFMLRPAGQLEAYEHDLDRIGIVHKIARRYRRRILNPEL